VDLVGPVPASGGCEELAVQVWGYSPAKKMETNEGRWILLVTSTIAFCEHAVKGSQSNLGIFLLLFFFGSTGDWIVSCNACLGHPGPWSSFLCFLPSWDDGSIPPGPVFIGWEQWGGGSLEHFAYAGLKPWSSRSLFPK
jgi:hypothetical protein